MEKAFLLLVGFAWFFLVAESSADWNVNPLPCVSYPYNYARRPLNDLSLSVDTLTPDGIALGYGTLRVISNDTYFGKVFFAKLSSFRKFVIARGEKNDVKLFIGKFPSASLTSLLNAIFAIWLATFAQQHQRNEVQTASLRYTRANPCNTGIYLGLDGGADRTGSLDSTTDWL